MKEGLGSVNIQDVELLAFQFLCMKVERPLTSLWLISLVQIEIIYLVVLMRRGKVLKKPSFYEGLFQDNIKRYGGKI